MKHVLIVVTSLVLLFSCAGKSETTGGEVNSLETSVKKNEKMVIGEAENVRILPADIIYDSRIDTGATTTSLHAGNLEIFERDGKKWVKFDLKGKNKTKTVEMKVKKFKNIKRHGAPDHRRPVVSIRLVLGNVSQKIDVTLNDRSKFTYPGLIGRNFMKDMMVVDVSQKYTVEPAVK